MFGNGSSVNDLAQTDFDFIRPYFSVGLNAWPLHPFVPSAYALELWSGLNRHDKELEFLLDSAYEKASTSGARLWLLRPRQDQLKLFRAVAPNHGGSQFELYGRANLPSISVSRIDRELGSALSFFRARREVLPVTLDDGSSVVRMISLALAHGFKRIVLAGVDLTETPYFWYDPEFVRTHGDFTRICRREPDEGTDTLLTRDRPFSAADFIFALSRVARNQFDSEILVSSGNSALSAELGVFRFGREGIA